MNRKEAEDLVYKSYLKAQKNQAYDTKDAGKRNPELTKRMILDRAGTPCAVVTGSKGKGSVANMIAAILQSEFTVGLMTSPHLSDFCERFRVDGRQITDEEFVEQMCLLRPEIEAIEAQIPAYQCISPMGIQAALGLSYFRDKKTNFNVLECGKGAKYDDVNQVKHKYAIINSIFLEHTRELGETLEEIAFDKAHIMTGEQSCVYTAEQKPEVMEILQARAEEYQVPLKQYGTHFYAEHIRYTPNGMIFDVVLEGVTYFDICISLLGEHQAKNCALAFCLSKDVLGTINIERAKKNLSKLNWAGRMELISQKPFILLDACINGESCVNVKNVLSHLKISEITLIVGIPDDKDYMGVVKNMREAAKRIILTKSQNPHYRFTDEQKRNLKEQGIETEWTNSIEEAFQKAFLFEEPIVILGTTSVVAEVKQYAL